MKFKQIVDIIGTAARAGETVEIYYPRTEHSTGGFREVEPYSLATDVGDAGEHLVFGKDRLSPGHIFNAFTVDRHHRDCHSFILGKIKLARLTGKKFKPRNNWKVEF